MKRLGGVLSGSVDQSSWRESAWEALVQSWPDRFSQIANPATSLLAIGGAAFATVLLRPDDERTVAFWTWSVVWLVGFAFAVVSIWTFSHKRNREIRRIARKKVSAALRKATAEERASISQ